MQPLKQVGSYKLAQKLGEGTFGKVFKGIHKDTKQQVAIKFISKKNTKQKDIQALKSQNQILSKISHENIIRFINCFDIPTDFIIVTDYAGTALDKLFEKKKKFSIQEIKDFSQQIFSAMYYLKQNKIAHRDLKPQNILIKDGIIKLCDFGFAKQLSASTQFMNSIRGTPIYIAPQIIYMQPYNDKVDVWSFGVIIYEFYCGISPFLDKTQQRVFHRIKHHKVKYPSSMPSQLKQILCRMLQKNPIHRISWQQLGKYDFFQKPKPLNQVVFNKQNEKQQKILKNLDDLGIPKKVSSEEQLQFENNDLDRNIKNLTNDTVVLAQMKKLQENLLRYNKDDGLIDPKVVKVDEQVLDKILAVLKSKLAGEGIVQDSNLQSVYNIINYLITKVKLSSDLEQSKDITKRKQILFAILKIAEQNQEPVTLAKQFVLIGFLTKNNFDGTTIDFDSDQQITDLCLKQIKNPKSTDCYNHAIKIMGILASQAMITLNNSFEFFIKAQASKILTVISQSFGPTEDKALVLECLQKFIHPNITAKVQDNNNLKNCFEKMKEQVSTVLLQKDFLTFNPLNIYSSSQAQQNYAKICYECLKNNQLFLKQFIRKSYWKQFVNHKKLRIFSLAFDYICIQQQKQPMLPNQLVHDKFIQTNTSTKMENVFLISRAAFNLTKKQSSAKKVEHAQSLLLQIFQLLSLDEQTKVKACRQVEGFLSFGQRIFEDILGETMCTIFQDPNLQKCNLDQGIILSIMKKLLIFKPPNEDIRLSICTAAKCIITRDNFIKLGFIKLKDNSDLINSIFNLFNHFVDIGAFVQLKEKMGIQFVHELICSFFSFMKMYGQIDQKSQINAYRKAEDKGIHMFLLNDDILCSKSLHFCLHIFLKISADVKYLQQVIDVIGLTLPKMKPYIKLQNNETEFIIVIIQALSLLLRKNENYMEEIKKFGIINDLQVYLRSKNQSLVHQSLTLVGNLAKHSTFFFDEFAKTQIFLAMKQCYMQNGYGSKNKIIKGLVYSIGNISFYNDRFCKEIKPMISIFKEALNSKDPYLIQNSLSTISNLLRHSDCYIESLYQHNIIQKVIQIVMASKTDDNYMSFGLNLLKKAILLPKIFNYHKIEEFQQIYYQKRKIVSPSNEFMKIMKSKIQNKI